MENILFWNSYYGNAPELLDFQLNLILKYTARVL